MIKLKPCPFCGAKKPIVTLVKANSFAAVICSIWSGGCGITTSTYATAKDAIKAWNNRASGWIPCGERLPELMQYVLCLLVSGEYRVMRRESTNYWQTDFKHPYRGDIITHWMPLPEPPEDKEDENRNDNERY